MLLAPSAENTSTTPAFKGARAKSSNGVNASHCATILAQSPAPAPAPAPAHTNAPASTFKDTSARAGDRARAGAGVKTHARFDPDRSEKNIIAHARARAKTPAGALATNKVFIDEGFCKSAEENYNNKSSGNPAPTLHHSIKKEKMIGSASDSNEANNLMNYGLAALVIGGVTLGCASALGAGLVPLAVAASVLILATVGVGAVAVSAVGAGSSGVGSSGAGSSPSSSPRTASHSSRVPSAPSSGGVSV